MHECDVFKLDFAHILAPFGGEELCKKDHWK